jgi:hypothetical protein
LTDTSPDGRRVAQQRRADAPSIHGVLVTYRRPGNLASATP